MRKPIRQRILGVSAAALATGGIATAQPAAADTWTDENCDFDSDGLPWQAFTRSYAQERAAAYTGPGGGKEGYEWGGGCYLLNGYDDTPGLPDSGGEGNDCSSFVHRQWGLDASGGGNWTMWLSGVYLDLGYTGTFYSCTTCPWKQIGNDYSDTNIMDAFVSNGVHIAMIYAEGSGGGDYMVHAKSDADGTDVTAEWYRNYGWRALARTGW